MATAEGLLTELLGVAQEQLRWYRAAVLPQVRATVKGALTSSQHRRAYELCNGERTMKQIGEESGASTATIGRWTKQWRDLGIAFENSDGRIEHLVSLESLGIELDV